MSIMKISVIIVNYNVAFEIEQCINSLSEFCKIDNLEIIVIDNASEIRDVELLPAKFPFVKFKLFTVNLGYAKANNYGIEISNGEYVLLLNPDTILTEDFITPIIKFIVNNPSAGACGPKLIYKNGSFQNSYGSEMGLMYETAEAFMFIGLLRYFSRFVNKNKIKSGTEFNVGWVSGACLLIRKKILLEIGGFNEEFFMNYEDLDLCKKIEDIGYKNYYFPQYRCIHIDQISQKKDYSKLVYTRYHSRQIYSKIHYGILKKYTVNFVHFLGLIIRIVLVAFLYKGIERTQRKTGYLRSLKLYFSHK